ncbi:DUF1294 domain-containing protein [Candidatus Gracilibacteria bacterium]|nr:DUF1294 domain-containing protein [Candidatus Gracilibacteria bacterium]
MNELLLYAFLLINIVGYIVMCTDKLKSIYKWWRISEKVLWVFAIFGGVFGIWLGMQWPLYHKAGKKAFRIGIPLIMLCWIIIGLYFLARG